MNMNNLEPTISVIIPTYNSPQMLTAVLEALSLQEDQRFEIVIADDGSSEETATCVQSFKKTAFPNLQHVWQEDLGFRLSQIRNKAAVAAHGQYLIFLDGDCLVRKNFIAQHRKLAEAGWYVVGNRVLLSQNMTQKILENPTHLPPLTLKNTFVWWRQKKLNRWYTLLNLPLGFMRRLRPKNWKSIKGCNMAFWKNDLLTINGFDEAYTGWGLEDSDLSLRLQRAGIRVKSGRYATTVLHLWHSLNDKSQIKSNVDKFNELLASNKIRAGLGVDQYI
jgi:glycosyltransferase involved in cell wall biosynthesis